jgi:hypothetical protein
MSNKNIPRKKLLTTLLKLSAPLNEIIPPLQALGWDSEAELVIFTRHHALAILKRFLENKLSSDELEDWANAVEGHDDIGFEAEAAPLLQSFITELANPLLTEPLTPESARAWYARLEQTRLTITIPMWLAEKLRPFDEPTIGKILETGLAQYQGSTLINKVV